MKINILSLVPTAYASTIVPNNSSNSVGELVSGIINYFSFVIGGLALLSLVYAGILFMSAGGNPDKLSKAKKALAYSLVGIFLVSAAVIIVNSVDKLIREDLTWILINFGIV